MKAGSPELRSFVNFILKKNPAKRPDADIVLQHPFIKKYAEIETSEELCNLIYAYNWFFIVFLLFSNWWKPINYYTEFKYINCSLLIVLLLYQCDAG